MIPISQIEKERANIEHRATINSKIEDELVWEGVPVCYAKLAIAAIARNQIPNVKITY